MSGGGGVSVRMCIPEDASDEDKDCIVDNNVRETVL